MTSDWTSGYVAEIDYTYGFYRDITPSLIRFALLMRGVAPPPERNIRYMELGFGQGVSVNVHAAGSGGEFWGTDFNPAQAAHAREMAEAAGSNARLLDAAFEDLLKRDDLPEFDFITLHGIWSWVSDENRRAICDFLHKKLAVGGAAYVSYNTLPGWTPGLALRHLMKQHERLVGSEAQGIADRIEKSIAFASTVDEAGALFFRSQAGAKDRLARLKGRPANYMAHEYFNRDWAPMFFSDVAGMMEEAKLSFAAPSNLLDHVDGLNLNAEALKLLGGIAHPILREGVRDFFVNQSFRRDIYVRGVRRLPAAEQAALLQDTRFALTALPEDIPMKATGALGEVQLQDRVLKPLIEQLAVGSFGPKRFGDIAGKLGKDISFAQAVQGLAILVGTGNAHPCQGEDNIVAATPNCMALNRHLADKSRYGAAVEVFASPVLGGGVSMPRLHQLFAAAMWAGAKTPAAYAKSAWGHLAAAGQRFTKDGKTLDSDAENLAQMQPIAETFQKRLPLLKSLGVV